MDILTRDTTILRLTIKRRIDGNIRSISIIDSFAILDLDLRNLCEIYNVENRKSYFPYQFVTNNTL